jgi:predicted transcriptional regulator
MKKLARREEEIMEFLWENGPMFVREIVALYDEPRPHFNTMSTVVRNLETLGYVGHNAYGSTYQYYAAVSRDEYRKMTLQGVVSKYFDNSYMRVVSSLVKEEQISLDELKELIRMVEEGNNI